MSKKQLIIDTDCGIDDAQALLIALAAPHVEVLGVTCVFGNTAVENVCQNVLRVLSVCEREGVRVLSNPVTWSWRPPGVMTSLNTPVLEETLKSIFMGPFFILTTLVVIIRFREAPQPSVMCPGVTPHLRVEADM